MRHPIFKDVPRGIPNVSPSEYEPPADNFADPEHIKTSPRLQYQNDRIFLGVLDAAIKTAERKDNGATEFYAMSGHPVGLGDDTHMITVAGTRAGKGRAVIVPNMLRYSGSVLATDPKGELAAETAKHRHEKLGHKVYVLDPFGVAVGCDEYRVAFNPMSILKPPTGGDEQGYNTLVEDAGLIADALVISTSKDEHWDASAKEVITALLLYLAFNPIPFTDNLPNLRRILRDDVKLTKVMNELAKSDKLDGILSGLAQSYLSKPDKEQASVLSTARRQTQFLDFDAMQRVLSGHDFDLNELRNNKTTIYLCLPAMRMGTCNRWLRLFINLVLAAMEDSTAPKPNPPLLLCLDEFATLGHMETIENAAGQIAGFGVKLWPIIQDLGQLESLYEKRWQTFMANAGVLQFFGNSDLTTLEWLSKRLGETTLRVATQNEVGYKQAAETAATGETWTNDVRPLLGVSEISTIFGRGDPLCRQLVIWAGKSPMILQRAYADKHELFK